MGKEQKHLLCGDCDSPTTEISHITLLFAALTLHCLPSKTLATQPNPNQMEKNNQNHLPHDLISSMILPRLPAKSLFRFACVSKLWSTTILDDPHFKDLQWTHAKANPNSLILIFKDEKYGSLDSVFYLDESCLLNASHRGHLLGYVNGLYLFGGKSGYKLWNPTTHQVLSLFTNNEIWVDAKFYGLGYDALKNQYKIVVVSMYYECFVYTLGTKGWRKITDKSDVNVCYYFRATNEKKFGFQSSNGAIHWLTTFVPSFAPPNWTSDFPFMDSLVSFNVHTEKFQSRPFPQDASWKAYRPMLFELSGRIHVCVCYKGKGGGDEVETDLSRMEDEEGCWSVVPRVFNPFRKDSLSRVVVTTAPTPDQMLLLYHINNEGLLMEYVAYTGDRIQGFGFPKGYFDSREFIAVNHVENLLSLKTLVPTTCKFKVECSRDN